MNRVRRVLSVFALTAMVGGLVSAATITETFTFTPATGTTNYNGTLTAAQGFNSYGTFGNLTDVSIFLQSVVNTTITATAPDTGTDQSGSVNAVAGLAVDDALITFTPATNTYSDTGGNFAATVGIPELSFLSPGTFTFNVGGGNGTVGNGANGCATGSDCASQNYVKTINTTFDCAGPPAAAFLCAGQYIGNGPINLFTSAGAVTTSINGGGNATISQATTETISGTITFTYTPPAGGTPEPATLFLMGSALVGVGLLRKRIKS